MSASLLNLFKQKEQDLREKLESIVLPRDFAKFKTLMNNVFISHASIEDYKQELTMTELSILNSIMKLVRSQIELMAQMSNIGDSSDIPQTEKNEPITDFFDLPILGSTVVGGLIGGLLLKTWGGVLFSIAGCALGMYFSTNKKKQQSRKKINHKIDVDKYILMLKRICSSIDEIVSNYTVSIEKIRMSYENQPKPTLATLYKPVLNRLANLYLATYQQKDDKILKKEIELLFRTLKNHHYEFINYSEANSSYYIVTSSPNILEPEVTKVAIVENGNIIETGECLIPEK